MRGRIRGHKQTLVASAARNASGDSGSLVLDLVPAAIKYFINVTAASGTNPTLDMYIQTSFDGGSTWHDMVHASQFTGTSQLAYDWANLSAIPQDIGGNFGGDAALSANQSNGGPLVPGAMRVKWVIAGTTPSFTFTVTAVMDTD